MSERTGKGYFRRGVNNQWTTLGRLMLGRVTEQALDRHAVRPTYASVMVTQNCNYKCTMCSFWHAHTENELTRDEIAVITRDLRALGIAQVNFTGGEPLLRDDLPDIVADTAAQDFRMIQITTNGSLATSARLGALLSAGARRFAISCDGTHDRHDLQRGVPGAWKKNISALDVLRELRGSRYPDIEIELPMVISKTNMADLEEILSLCEEYRAVLHVQFLDNVQYFTASAEFDQLVLSPTEVDEVVDRIHRHIDERAGMDPLLTHEGMEYVRAHLKGTEREGAPPARCGVGYTLLYIDSLGNVFPGCFAIAPVGNVREQPLHAIVGSELHGTVAKDIYRMNCPRCPNGYAWSALINPRALATELAGRARRRLNLL